MTHVLTEYGTTSCPVEGVRADVDDDGTCSACGVAVTERTTDEASAGVWIARHSDWSGIAVFATEIEALRYAVDHSMQVAFMTWGEIR